MHDGLPDRPFQHLMESLHAKVEAGGGRGRGAPVRRGQAVRCRCQGSVFEVHGAAVHRGGVGGGGGGRQGRGRPTAIWRPTG